MPAGRLARAHEGLDHSITVGALAMFSAGPSDALAQRLVGVQQADPREGLRLPTALRIERGRGRPGRGTRVAASFISDHPGGTVPELTTQHSTTYTVTLTGMELESLREAARTALLHTSVGVHTKDWQALSRLGLSAARGTEGHFGPNAPTLRGRG
ncbi:hypothetical protein [Streptomyces goshikiensis]